MRAQVDYGEGPDGARPREPQVQARAPLRADARVQSKVGASARLEVVLAHLGGAARARLPSARRRAPRHRRCRAHIAYCDELVDPDALVFATSLRGRWTDSGSLRLRVLIVGHQGLAPGPNGDLGRTLRANYRKIHGAPHRWRGGSPLHPASPAARSAPALAPGDIDRLERANRALGWSRSTAARSAGGWKPYAQPRTSGPDRLLPRENRASALERLRWLDWVGAARFELTTPGSGGRCSIQMSYAP